MRSINLKIVLAIVLCSTLALIINGIININISTSVIKDEVMHELAELTEKESVTFQRKLDKIKSAGAVMEGLLLASFDIDRLGDEEYVDSYKSEYYSYFIELARELQLLDAFIYFNPQLYKGGQIGIVDLERDGSYKRQDEYSLAEIEKSRIESAEFAWYSEAVKEGQYWTAPFYWEPYDMTVISYTQAVYVGNRLLAVVGSALHVDEEVEYFTSKETAKGLGLFVFDSDLNFIIERTFVGRNLKEVSQDDYEYFKGRLVSGERKGNLEYEFANTKRVLFFEVMDNGWILCSSVIKKSMWAKMNSMTTLLIIFLVIVIAVSSFIAFFIARSISNPIKSITVSMDRIATGDGDLTAKLDITSKDEIGLLAGRFNAFIEKLTLIVEGAKSSASKDESIVRELQKAVADSSSAINQIAANINSVKGQIDSLDSNIMDSTTSIEEVSANINSINNQVENQGAAVEQSTAAIEQMISSLNSVVQVTRRKLDSVEQLVNTVRQGGEQLKLTNDTFNSGVARRISEITEMVKVINSISAQTNLLAMNASIEAAHAGESGRGFAVVAEEIRSMAETSSESARNISQIINQIVDSIKQTADSVETTSQAFVAIDREVLDFKGAFQEIASSTSEISTGGNEVLKAVTELNQITSLIMTGIKEINTAASQVRGAMLDVKQNSSQSLSGINEISKGTGYVEESVYRVSHQTEELANETEVLLEELNRFKT